ncbi:hypothetical protein HZC32_01500 [Candidatus Woesearchaeota archaeon]|nr:hypothetical protein [Candidatus Woesearchaeota archaeon]
METKYKNFIAGKTGSKCERPNIELENLEATVNKWLSKNKGIEVIQMAQSQTVMSTVGAGEWFYEVMVSVMYKEPTRE